MNIVAFAPQFNTAGRKDATGAFQPEARAFLRVVGDGSLVLIDNRKPEAAMRAQVLAALSPGTLTVAFFCHGLGKRIQFGFGLAHVALLASALAGDRNRRVVLYACNTGKGNEPVGGDGGFADELRDALCRAGCVDCRVDAHTTAGHTTCNPYVRRFEGMGSPVGGVGGYWLVAPGSALWTKWRTALRDTDLRFRFPFMSVAEIHRELAG